MISIIICSRYNKINITLKTNISKTIGIPYEIIFIDNSQNKHSIFSAYNEGIKRSKYPYVCFIHEDIMFRTNRWGELICEAFKNDRSIGMIGVIGSSIIFDIFDGWWHGPLVGQIIQSTKDTPIKDYFNICYDKVPCLSDAVICDGVFLAFPKIMFDKISFDSQTYKGFHCYDSDISMQVLSTGYKIKILNNVLVEHYSPGTVDMKFHNECSIFMKKWHSKLPISIEDISTEKLCLLRLDYINKILRKNYVINESINLAESKSWRYIFILSKPLRFFKKCLLEKEKNQSYLISNEQNALKNTIIKNGTID